LEQEWGSRCAVAFYCSFDPAAYFPESRDKQWTLGYLGTYSDDRQPTLDRLLLAPARQLPQERFVVAGPLYPAEINWPPNVQRISHLSPAEHRSFYNSQHFTLNITRTEMIHLGWSPSVRLFEAAACAIPIISDAWSGLETFFAAGREILIAETTTEMQAILHDLPEAERAEIGRQARERVLSEHTAAHRALQLEELIRRMEGSLKIGMQDLEVAS
jgi:spore maturation protein CgeB